KGAELRDVASGERVARLDVPALWTRGVAITPDGRHALTGGWAGTLRVWSIPDGKPEQAFPAQKKVMKNIALTRDGKLAVTTMQGGAVELWDLEHPSDQPRWSATHGKDAQAAVFTGDGRVLSVAWDTALLVTDVGTGKDLRTFEAHRAHITS